MRKFVAALVVVFGCSLLVTMPAKAADSGYSWQRTSDSCGVRPKKPDGSMWSCSFVDEFNFGYLNRNKWKPQTQITSGTTEARACYLDNPSVISVSGGTLNLSVRKLSTPIKCAYTPVGTTSYVAGMVSTYRLFSQQYGRFEARMKSTATDQPGLQEAFWLWPDDRVASSTIWPYSGEIDIAETYSQYPTLSVPFLHYFETARGAQVGVNTAWNCNAPRGQFNTFVLEWSANRLEIFVNGVSCLVNTSGDPAFQKPYIVAFTQLLGTGTNAYDGRAPLPATLSVDYMKVWK